MNSQDVECIFRLRCPRAQQVFLLGNFNNWSTTAHPMDRIDGQPGRWETSVQLSPGQYTYCYFVIDDECITDRTRGLTFAPGGIINEGSTLLVPSSRNAHMGGPRILSN
jgi:hypothetical protein